MERSEFLRKLIMNGSLAAVLPVLALQACEEDPDNDTPGGDLNITLDLDSSDYDDLKQVGGHVILSAENIIVINRGNDEYSALSSVCTHQGCTVGYNNNSSTLPCACHGSVFDTSGSVLNGPANSPLKVYSTTRSDNLLIINR